MTVFTVAYYRRLGFLLITMASLGLFSCGSDKHGSKTPNPDQLPLVPPQSPENNPEVQDEIVDQTVKTLKFPSDSGRKNFKFASFNIENFGDGQDKTFLDTRRTKLRNFLESNFHDVDVLAVQEIKDPENFKSLVAPNFECFGGSAERSFRAQHVLVCLRPGLTMKVASNDDNFLIEEIARGELRPAVHGIITDKKKQIEYFYFVSVHLKAMVGEEFSATRLEQSRTLADFLQKAPKHLPQIIAGDFNTHNDDLKKISAIFSEKVGDLEYVGNNLNKTYVFNEESGSKLDHFWASNIIKKSASIKVTSTAPCSSNLPSEDSFFEFKKFISDHCPIFLSLEAR